MSSFENDACSFEEYKAGEPDRIMETELAVAGLYTLMQLCQSGAGDIEAVKLASRIDNVAKLESGLFRLKFMIFNPSTADHNAEAVFESGLLRQDLSQPISVWTSTAPERRYPIVDGYFREPSGDSDAAEKELQEMLRRSEPQLVDAVARKEA